MPVRHCHVAAELPFVHASVLLHPAKPQGRDFGSRLAEMS